MTTSARTFSAQGVFLITPHDTNALAHVTQAIRANAAGTVNIRGVDGNTCVCNFAAGETRIIRATHILSTSTTATGLEGMYLYD